MPEPDTSGLADPAEEILVHVETSFVQQADQPVISDALSDGAAVD